MQAQTPPPLPRPVLAVGVTGHRSLHGSFPADPAPLRASIDAILGELENAAKSPEVCGADRALPLLRMVNLLADGADHIGSSLALERGWELVAPLPFGKALNTAINAQPSNKADAQAILDGDRPADPATAERAENIRTMIEQARVFELAERDALIRPCFLASCETPENASAISSFVHLGSQRSLIAGRILIEQSDILITVWDGQSTSNIGGTGHTARLALEAGVPVLWIDPAQPELMRLVQLPEELSTPSAPVQLTSIKDEIASIVKGSIGLAPPASPGPHVGLGAISAENWRRKSSLLNHGYRRVEKLFGEAKWSDKFSSVTQIYETPETIIEGSAAPLIRDLEKLGGDAATIPTKFIFPRFAWTNGIGARMADVYRSGMVINFTLGAAAIIAGVMYLPLVDTSQKWIFASLELALLLAILTNTVTGQRRRLHERWMEVRRCAEYLRHAGMLYAFGVMRPTGDWPRGLRGQWPEWYTRMAYRGMGLPEAKVDQAYLRSAAEALRDHLVVPQRDYHRDKAKRLHNAHRSIEHVAERMFGLAIIAVSTFLLAFGASQFGLIEQSLVIGLAKWFTVIGVALPTISGALAAIGYFGDFDRFADISQVASEKLDALSKRIDLYLALPEDRLGYGQLATLTRFADDVTFAEIQAWQAAFSGKRITVPA